MFSISSDVKPDFENKVLLTLLNQESELLISDLIFTRRLNNDWEETHMLYLKMMYILVHGEIYVTRCKLKILLTYFSNILLPFPLSSLLFRIFFLYISSLLGSLLLNCS